MSLSVRTAVGISLAFVISACHDATTANSLTTHPVVQPPPFTVTVLDSAVTDYPSWGGLNLVSFDGSVGVVTVDEEFARLRYAACSTACGKSSNWSQVTVDSNPYRSFGLNASAVVTAAGITVVYEDEPNTPSS